MNMNKGLFGGSMLKLHDGQHGAGFSKHAGWTNHKISQHCWTYIADCRNDF
jgi:hypothetical protein